MEADEHTIEDMITKARADQQESARLWTNALKLWEQIDAEIDARRRLARGEDGFDG